MSSRVVFEIDQRVAHVQLNRPEKHNALDEQTFRELCDIGDYIRDLCDTSRVRAVVLSGRGESFCSGLDTSILKSVAGGDGSIADRLLRDYDGVHTFVQYAATVWHNLPVPVIAAIQGSAIGAGLQIALNADIRVVHPRATLAFREVRFGLIPDMTGLQRLRHLMPIDKAKWLVFGAYAVMGHEAVEWGLATQIHDNPVDYALNKAYTGFGFNEHPEATQVAKELLNAWDTQTVEQGTRSEARAQRALIRGLVPTK